MFVHIINWFVNCLFISWYMNQWPINTRAFKFIVNTVDRVIKHDWSAGWRKTCSVRTVNIGHMYGESILWNTHYTKIQTNVINHILNYYAHSLVRLWVKFCLKIHVSNLAFWYPNYLADNQFLRFWFGDLAEDDCESHTTVFKIQHRYRILTVTFFVCLLV